MRTETKRVKTLQYKSPKEFDSKNLNYAFYTEYQEAGIFLKQENKGPLSEKIQAEIGQSLNSAFLNAANNKESVRRIRNYGNRMSDLFKELQAQQFSVSVCYPGLLIGTGYPHMTKQVRGEIQVGTLFDWTTGAPYYPGSSVKGVLRHLFKIASGEGVEANECRKELSERINEVSPGFNQILTQKNCQDLENVIFENDGSSDTKPNVFYGAYIVGFRKNASRQQKKLLEMDSLTPHEDKLKNPIPINMLRILPDVCLTFNMRLSDINLPDSDIVLTSDQLLALFKNIILDLGFGAKTHTGYGVVVEIKESDIVDEDGHHIQKDQPETSPVSESVKKTPVIIKRDPSEGPICPKCGSKVTEENNGRITCIGKCGMVYGSAFRENLSFNQIRLLLNGEQIITPKGQTLFVDPDDSIEEFTTKSGAIKFRLKFQHG